MIKVGIVGATGYAGAELVRLLLGHPDVEIVWFGSKSYVDKKFSDEFGAYRELADEVCKADDIEKMAEVCDVVFTATPQGYLASVLTEEILAKAKFIDCRVSP